MPERQLIDAFAHATAAERYAQSRPYYHPIVISEIRTTLGMDTPVRLALDVGCGTGQSTLALLDLAEAVVGVDTSPAMLAHVPQEPGLAFVVAPAEDLPFPDGTFDLMTVAAAFHWFERERFLTEAARVLRPAAWLVVYDNGFLGIMEGQPAFADWVRERYVTRYPTPPRDRRPLTGDEANRHGFRLASAERYTNAVEFVPEALVDYLLTQSNLIAAVEEGRERLRDVRVWLGLAVTPLFSSFHATFRFGGAITYLQKY